MKIQRGLIRILLLYKQFIQITRRSRIVDPHTINRESDMSAHVLLNLLNELGKKIKMRGFAEHLICLTQRV